MSYSATRRSGFALVSVIIVLAALAVIATPFAISMRNHAKTSAVTSAASRVRLGAEGARNHAVQVLSKLHPGADLDPSPDSDTAAELEVGNWDALSPLDVRNPRGDLWSARAEDEQGKANLNTVSPMLIGNLLGGTILSGELSAEAGALRVENASAFPETGFVFVDGEVIEYSRRTGSSFEGCTRGRFSELAWFSPSREHADGSPVIPLNAWEVAAHRSRRDSTVLTELTSIWSLREVPFAGGPSPQVWSLPEIESLEEDVTVHSAQLVGRGWIDPQVLLQPVEGGGIVSSILVGNARYYGPGTTIRLTDGQIAEHSIVTRSEPEGRFAFRLTLESPLSSGFDVEDTRVYALARSPVNLNTASPRLLRALVLGLRSSRQGGDIVDSGVAEQFAARVIGARSQSGLQSHEDLYKRVLHPAEEAGELTNGHVRAIYTNALHSGDMLIGTGTTGFCYESYGTYRIEATAVSNARSGLERGRHTIEQIVSAVPQTDLLQVWASQRDFEDLIVSSRASRYFLTGPTNQHRYEPGNVPPSRVPVHLGWQRFPSQDPDEGFVQLEPYRKGDVPGVFIEHFDNDDDPEGRDLSKNDYNVALGGGGGGGSNGPAAWVGQFGVVPYGIDLWYRPDGAPGPIFDTGINDIEGRLTVFIEGNDVVLQVADNVLDDPRTQWPEVAEARWSSPNPIEARTWYHLGGSWRGSRPSDITLTVDGIPRGKKRGLTKLTSTLSDLTSLAPPTPTPGGLPNAPTPIPPNASSMVEEAISVESTQGFPPQGVIRIGNEIIEYNQITGNTFITSRGQYQRGGRGARGTLAAAFAHPVGSTVELYGYATPISSPILPYNANLAGSLGLPDIGILSGGDPIEVPSTKEQLGLGLTDASTYLSMRSPLPGNPSDRAFMEAFSEDGGVALVVSSYGGLNFGVGQVEMTIGGIELIRYARADRGSATLTGIQRYGDLREFYDTGKFIGGAVPSPEVSFLDEESWQSKNWRIATNQQTIAAFGDGDYTAIVPLSIGIAGLTAETLLDPQQTGHEERLQIGIDELTEWVRFDSVQVSDGWVTRNQANLLGAVWSGIQRDSTLNGGRGQRIPPNQQGQIVPITARLNLKADIFDRLVKGRLRFRGQYGTTAQKHQDGELVLPVFRCWKTGRITGRPGRGDWVTTITPNGNKEGNVINWAWTDDDGSDPRDHIESYFAFVQVGVNLHVPTNRLDSQGQNQSLSQLDSREIVRIVKYPSGELPEQTGGQIFFGQRYNGSGGVAAFLDEVEFRRFEDPVAQRANSRYRLTQQFGEDARTILVMPDTVEINHWDGYGIRNITSRLFDGGGVVQIGDELIAYQSVDPSNGELQVAADGRGFLLSEAATHAAGERMVYLPQFRVTTLTKALQATDDQIFVTDASQFPPSGMVLIGTEVIAYVRRPNNQILQLASERIDQGGTGDDTRGLLRGRFGTAPTSADTGSTVYLLPFRYWDRYQPLSDNPEISYFQAYVSQKRAFWRAVTWDEQIPEPQFMDVRSLVRIGGKVPWDIEPGSTPFLLEFDEPIDGDSPNHIRSQGDDLELRLFFEFKVGAFDALTFLPNAWKKTPLIRMVAVDYIAPTFVESHVETR